MSSYKCLTGEMVLQYHDETVEIYETAKIGLLLTDPITHDWIKDPVIVNGNLYDRKSIQRWLRKSNIDPMTGEDLSGNVELYPCSIIKYLLYAFEEAGDTLIFHSPPNDIRFAHEIGTLLPVHKLNKFNDKNKYFDVQDISCLGYSEICEQKCLKNQRINFKDLSSVKDMSNCELNNCYNIPPKFKGSDDIKIKVNISNYSLAEYLFTNIITGKMIPVDNAVVAISGMLFDVNHVDYGSNKFRSGSVEEFLHKYGSHKFTNFKYIINGWYDALSISDLSIEYEPLWYSYRLYRCKQKKKIINSTIMVRSPAEKVYERLIEIQTYIDKDQSFKTALQEISKLVDNRTISRPFGADYGNKCPIEQMREKMGVPFVAVDNIYGKDLSLLDLSNSRFTGLNLKDYIFAGTNLTNTVFNKCEFSECCFVGAILNGCKFINCEFRYEQPFYMTKFNKSTKFIGCKCTNNSFFDMLLQR